MFPSNHKRVLKFGATVFMKFTKPSGVLDRLFRNIAQHRHPESEKPRSKPAISEHKALKPAPEKMKRNEPTDFTVLLSGPMDVNALLAAKPVADLDEAPNLSPELALTGVAVKELKLSYHDGYIW